MRKNGSSVEAMVKCLEGGVDHLHDELLLRPVEIGAHLAGEDGARVALNLRPTR